MSQDPQSGAIDAKEVPVPSMVYKRGVSNQHAFELTTTNGTIGVIYAHEPHGDNGKVLVHVSISKTSRHKIEHPSREDIERVGRLLKAHDLKWPEFYDVTRFQAGPFAGYGLHIWETTNG